MAAAAVGAPTPNSPSAATAATMTILNVRTCVFLTSPIYGLSTYIHSRWAGHRERKIATSPTATATQSTVSSTVTSSQPSHVTSSPLVTRNSVSATGRD